MKIVILGAGQLGTALAKILTAEDNDVTLVDENAAQLDKYRERVDLQTVVGRPSHPQVLARAEAGDADILLAVTNDDETNIVACQVAHSLFNVPTKILRLQSTAYASHAALFEEQVIPADHVISPEKMVAENIARLTRCPGARQVVEFAGGRLLMAAVRAAGRMVGAPLRALAAVLPGTPCRVASIQRGGRALAIDGDTVVERGDEVFFVAPAGHVRAAAEALAGPARPYERVFVAGGGNCGMRLAELLEHDCRVRLIERDPARAEFVASQLDKTVVLCGDATDEDLLHEEYIEHADMFCALTSDDEDNILSAMLAKSMGARTVVSLIGRPSYADLIASDMIDVAVSPQQDSLGALLCHIRRGDIVAAHSLRRGAAEAIEAVAHGDAGASRVVGRPIGEVRLPRGVSIDAVVRGQEVMMPRRDLVVENGDHVVLFLDDKRAVAEVEKLFQVSATAFL